MSVKNKTASGRILHNSFWYGLETILETVVFLSSSIAVARYLGPHKLGYYSYIGFFVNTVTRTGGSGLASATRKYMAEFLVQNKIGIARGIYHLAYRYQLLASTLIAGVGIGGILLFGESGFKLMSCILIGSIIPSLMSMVPAQANQAFEDVYSNTISAFGYLVTYAIFIVCTVRFHWDLVGVASAFLAARVVELVMRTIPLHAKLRKMPLEPVGAEITSRIRNYCIQSVGIQLLMSVVWDRSEMIFLRAFSTLEQMAFYSVSYTFATNLLLVPRTFGSATGITLMVESSRDPSRVDSIVKNACRYLLFVAIPVHLGAAAITREAIGVTYGPKYMLAVPVLIVAAILSLPRAFQEFSEVLMRAADRQKQLLIWLSITAIVNVCLDYLLIPRFGAVGAAWGNGLSQAFGIMAVWQVARRLYVFSFPIQSAIRFSLAGLLMSVVAFFISRSLGGWTGLILAIIAATPTYLFFVRTFRAFDPSDRVRLAPIGNRLPAPIRRFYTATIAFITPV